LDIDRKQSGFSRFLFGAAPVNYIIKPYGITAQEGYIYICDTEKSVINIIDLENKKFEIFSPGGRGKLGSPKNCISDNNGNLYVADLKRKQIVVFDSSRVYLDAFGEAENFTPVDLAIIDSIIYVVNMTSHEVIAYNKNTKSKIFTFPKTEPKKQDHLFTPLNIVVDDSIIYISDFGDSKIKKFTHNGKYISSIGSYGRFPGQFARLKGIAIDSAANIYAVDASFENVQIFNKNEKLLMAFGGGTHQEGGMLLPAQVCIDYNNIKYFQDYVDPDFNLEYLILVSNQFGPYKVNVYGYVKLKE